MKRLIVTADDFGVSRDVNEAVEDSHRRGILSAASLMVMGEAADDAVARAQRLPALGVGLHLVLIDGVPVSPPEQIPDLVDAAGRFREKPTRIGARIYFNADLRRQVEIEIRAQLTAFRATGLRLDHVNAHHHFHLHPVVRDILLKLAREFGVAAIRVPREPSWHSWLACGDRIVSRAMNAVIIRSWALRHRLRRAGIAYNDWQLGLSDTGDMDAARTRRLLSRLPDGVTEIYFHPSRGNPEHLALVDADIHEFVRHSGIAVIPFAAL